MPGRGGCLDGAGTWACQIFGRATPPSAPRHQSKIQPTVGDLQAQLVSWRGEGARIGPLPGDEGSARLTFLSPDRPPSQELVAHCMSRLASLAYGRSLTSAVGAATESVLAACGFQVAEEMVVLTKQLDRDQPSAVPPPGFSLRRSRRRSASGVLLLDAASFPPEWRLGGMGLREALRATPRSRMSIVHGPHPAGYAITGMGHTGGFVQRLAVSPEHRRAGIGTALLSDGLAWLHRQGAVQATVNTQSTNQVALSLYRRLGFERSSQRMAVMSVSKFN